MSSMSDYCKAYYLRQLRAFSGWREAPAAQTTGAQADPLEDDTVLYLHDSFVVTRGIYAHEDIVFDDVTEAWKEFCSGELGFVPVPREAQAV